MKIPPIIEQLRTYCPALLTVGGAADWQAGLETVVNPEALPSGFVVPLDDVAEDNELQNGLRQAVTERISVIVEFDNSPDRRGQAASGQVEDMKYAVFKAILNWRNDPDRAQRGLQYGGARLLAMDRARLWWSFDFELEVTILDEDGFQEPAVDLLAIRVDEYVTNEPLPPATPEAPVEVGIVVHPP